MALEPGQLIDDKYRVVRCIGEGGMGAVYEGENLRIKRRVAIKTLHSGVAQNVELVARFEREAQAAGRIGSDHIMEVLDLGLLPSGERYIVMEFLDGEPLAKRIERSGRMSAEQLTPIIRQLLSGLGAAHAAGIVHRDLKPENVYILRQKAGWVDFVKIIDFGISKFQSDAHGAIAMTTAGQIMGTPLYMSPEQANGSSEADARSDLYSVGMMMYEALAGTLPFHSKSLNELLFEIVLNDLPRLETFVPDVDPRIAAIVTKATAKKREERFGSAQEMIAALETLRTPSNRPPHASTLVVSSSQPGLARTPGSVPPAVATQWIAPQAGDRPLGRSTAGAFTHASQPGMQTPAPPKSKAPAVVGISLVLAVVLAGGGFAISRVAGRSAALAGAPSVAASVTAPPSPSEPPPPDPAASVAPIDAPAASAAPSSATSADAGKKPPPVGGGAHRPAVQQPAGAKPKPTKPGKPDWGY